MCWFCSNFRVINNKIYDAILILHKKTSRGCLHLRVFIKTWHKWNPKILQRPGNMTRLCRSWTCKRKPTDFYDLEECFCSFIMYGCEGWVVISKQTILHKEPTIVRASALLTLRRTETNAQTSGLCVLSRSPRTVASLYQPHNKSLTHCACMLPSSCSVCLRSCRRWKVSSLLRTANLHNSPLPVSSWHAAPWSQEETEELLRLRNTPWGGPQRSHNKSDWRAKNSPPIYDEVFKRY